MPNFLRRTWYKYSKLGKGRKSKQKWRRPTGRDNKLREKRKNRGPVVSVGYKNKENQRGLINNKLPVRVNNISELNNLKKENILILGKIGKKKKIEIAKKAKEMKLDFANFNINKFLKQIEKQNKEIKK